MVDAWQIYATPYAPQMAFVSFNQGYADAADTDSREVFLVVDLTLKQPRADGLSSNEEFDALSVVEEKLEAALAPVSAVEVGRRTSGGHRIFYYYVSGAEAAAITAVAGVATASDYALKPSWAPDPHKDGFWKQVYPDADGLQVMGDLSVLNTLDKNHDDTDAPHAVDHWSYFASDDAARKFAQWARQAGYAKVAVKRAHPGGDAKARVEVTFTHHGTMRLRDIAGHSVAIGRAATRFGGRYDGWETAIVRAK